MGVFTERSIDDISPVLAEFGLGGDVAGFQGLTEGVENSSFIILTRESSYILTLIERRVDCARIELAHELMTASQARGLVCPSLLATRNGKRYSKFQGRLWLLQSKLDGLVLRDPTIAQTRAAGATLATIHEAGRQITRKSENPIGVRQWPGLLCALESIAPHAAYLTREIVEDIRALATDWPSDLPSGAIHGDFFKSNVLVHNHQLRIIDFLLCCQDLYAFDLALALTSWGFETSNTLSPQLMHAFLWGYQSVRPLQSEERSALSYLCRIAAIRIILTRALDQNRVQRRGAVEIKDPEEFLQRYVQLRTWNTFTA